MKLLIIDDEIDVCHFVRGHFVRHGMHVLVANSGRQALHLIQREHPELILLDIRMPEMDGLECLKRIRQIDPRCFIFMLTQVDDQIKRDKVHALGISGYLTKPVHLDELDAAILPILRGF